MVLVSELVCWGTEHAPVNAGILETIRIAMPSESIYFVGEQSHLEEVKNQISLQMVTSIIWKTIVLPPRHSKFFSRLSVDLNSLNHLLNIINKDSHSYMVVTCINPSILMALKFLQSFVHRGKKVQVILHRINELDWIPRNPFLRLQHLRTALILRSNKNIQYIVLAKPVRDALLRKIPFLEKNVVVIDHPIPPNEGTKENIDLRPPFRFGFLGIVSEDKGFSFYLRLASEMSKKFSDYVEFHTIGYLQSGQKMAEMDVLRTKPSVQSISRYQYIHHLKEIHFVCLPYQKKGYEFIVSGVLLDAIAWGKPFIAMKLPIFEDLISKFGDIGYLCDDETEFCKTVEDIIKKTDVSRYRKQILALRKIRDLRTPMSLSSHYRKLYEKLTSKGS